MKVYRSADVGAGMIYVMPHGSFSVNLVTGVADNKEPGIHVSHRDTRSDAELQQAAHLFLLDAGLLPTADSDPVLGPSE
jgi:hypothetical protein